MKKTIKLTENELEDVISESMKRILNENKNRFITLELPVDMSDDEDVMEVIRSAMKQIGYEYYDNQLKRLDGTIIYRYAPFQPPVEYHLN